mgnify:CR=1 FL=1
MGTDEPHRDGVPERAGAALQRGGGGDFPGQPLVAERDGDGDERGAGGGSGGAGLLRGAGAVAGGGHYPGEVWRVGRGAEGIFGELVGAGRREKRGGW